MAPRHDTSISPLPPQAVMAAASAADSAADADDEDPVISRLHKCDTLFTTGSSQTEEHLISVAHHVEPCSTM